MCGATQGLEKLAEEFNGHFLVQKAAIVSLEPEHQSETHFLKRRISVDEFGWHVELDQRYVKSFLDAMAMNHCKSMATLGSKGTGGQQCDGEAGRKGTSRAPFWCWNLSVHDRATLRHCLQYEGNHERGSWTDHSLKDKVEADRALLQRTPAKCVELPLGRQVGRRHPCDGGCRLGRRPKDKVLNVWRSVGNWPVLHGTSLVGVTGNSVTIVG